MFYRTQRSVIDEFRDSLCPETACLRYKQNDLNSIIYVYILEDSSLFLRVKKLVDRSVYLALNSNST